MLGCAEQSAGLQIALFRLSAVMFPCVVSFPDVGCWLVGPVPLGTGDPGVQEPRLNPYPRVGSDELPPRPKGKTPNKRKTKAVRRKGERGVGVAGEWEDVAHRTRSTQV
jgi:hypothetical protein